MKILIIGAGVAGPVIALALKRCGHEPIIVDKFNPTSFVSEGEGVDFGHIGGGFSLLHSSLRFLNDLDLLEETRAVAFNRSEKFSFLRMDGSVIYEWDATDRKGPENLKYTAQILRSKLHTIVMRRVAKENIRVFVNKTVDTVDLSNPNQVVAHFKDGTTIAADLLIGSDGMHSQVRRLTFGTDLKAKFDGMIGYIGVSTYDKADNWDKPVCFLTAAKIKKRLVVVRVSETEMFWEITEYGGSERENGDDWRSTASDVLPGEVSRLAELVQSWGAPQGVVNIIARSTRLTPLIIYDAPTLKSFTKGRVALIGDAAHGMPPHLGQGLTMAYEDAAVLSESLANFPNDHIRAFEIYNKLRVPQAHAMSDRTHSFGEQNFPQTTVARVFGEVSLKGMAVVFNWLNLITVLGGHYKEDVKKAIAGGKLRISQTEQFRNMFSSPSMFSQNQTPHTDNIDDGDDDVATITRAWINERSAPDILPFEGAAIARLREMLEVQGDNVDALHDQFDAESAATNDLHFVRSVYLLEMERVKFVIQSYLRARLFKIEQKTMAILKSVEYRSRLSADELAYAERFNDIVNQSYQKAFLSDSLPISMQKLDDPITVGTPDLNQAVFAKVKEDTGDLLLPK
ncbi:hypothetical protein HK100_006223 [Physocladia obscura]|uniref:FAD-binding domain-containing protein n=1 Tax=Physocladia obscura TaxID=109957 RepID=A0AAD5XBG5_9FUNG|nr:hypothetical protein HK100_006223 [Physocladia obscura]